MKKIFKYTFPINPGVYSFSTYTGFSLLSVQIKDGRICMWAVIDIQTKPRMIDIAILYTGDFVNPRFPYYLGTVVDDTDPHALETLVYHAWAKEPLDPWNPRHFVSSGPLNRSLNPN